MSSKTALITGAAHRIGAAITRDLHKHGMNVVIHHHHSTAAAAELAAELNTGRGDSACTVQGDLLETDSYGKIIQQAYAFKQRLDVLINNASAFFPSPLGQISLPQWQKLVGVNMQAPLFLAQHAADYLAENRGCIINMTDIHALRPLKDHAVYSATKAGLAMLTRALAKDLGPAIRVNAISPGAILWSENQDQDRHDDILAQTVMKRTGHVDDITNAVRYLIDGADYMTGEILTIDGGRTLYS